MAAMQQMMLGVSGVTATKLIFYTQPDGGVTGVDLTQQPVVRAVNNSNVLDTSFTGNVTIAVYSGSGTLSGTATVAAVAGVATFTNLRITQSAGGHNVLKASASGLTDGRSGQMTVMPAASASRTVLSYGAATSDRTDCGSGSSMDDLAAGGVFTVMLRIKRTSTGNNQYLWSKYKAGNTGHVGGFDDGIATGDVNMTVGQTGSNAFSITGASGDRVVVGEWNDLGFVYNNSDGTRRCRIYKAAVGSAITEISTYGGSSGNGSGTGSTDAGANLWIGGLELTGANPVKADIEWYVLFNKVLTTTQMRTVQIGMDRMSADIIKNATGTTADCVLIQQLNGTGTLTDLSGNGNAGTTTGATTTTGETVEVPTALGNSLDQIDKTYYWQQSSHSEIAFTTTATSVSLGLYRDLSDAAYDAQNCISVFEGTTYKGRVLASTGYAYGTLALTAGSKTVRLVHSVRSRNGSAGTGEGFEGTHIISARFNASATRLVPSTPSTHYLFLTDSSTDGFVTDTEGEHGPINQLRNYLYAGGSRVSTFGYGGHTLYKVANDGTARTATVTAVKAFNPSHLIIELGLNDYSNNLWSPSSFETALGTLLSDLNTEFPSLLIYLVTCPTLATGEGANAGGNTVAQFRTAQSNAASGKSYVTVRTGTTGWFNGTNLGDSIHPNNDGGDEIYANAKTMLGV